jgi:hypothetical protein
MLLVELPRPDGVGALALERHGSPLLPYPVFSTSYGEPRSAGGERGAR